MINTIPKAGDVVISLMKEYDSVIKGLTSK